MPNIYAGGRNLSQETSSGELLEKTLETLEAEIQSAELDSIDLEGRVDDLENSNAILENRVDAADAALDLLEPRVTTIENDISVLETSVNNLTPKVRGNGMHLIAFTFAIGNALSQADALTQFGGLYSNWANGDYPLPFRNDFNPALYTLTQIGPKLLTDPSVHLKFSQNGDGTTRMYIENDSLYLREVQVRVVSSASNVGMHSNDLADSASLTVELKNTSPSGAISRYITPNTSIINASSTNNNSFVTDYNNSLVGRVLTDSVVENGTLNNGTDYQYRMWFSPGGIGDFRLRIQSRVDTGGNDVFYLRSFLIRVLVKS